MKAYFFNIESGVFEGETYVDPDLLEYEEGVTTVVPPEYVYGQVPVFDRQRQIWEVISINIARQLLDLPVKEAKERNS